MNLLRRLPESSVLWLLRPSTPAAAALIAENLRREAAAAGVSGDRLLFAPRAPKAEHLRRQKAADLFLDTFYYGAHSTATDALRGGLPVLTTPGDAFARRVGVSLLYNVGLGEALVTSSFREFEDTGVWLCGSKEGQEVLRGMRRWLLDQGQRSHLFDTSGFTRDLERGYEALWEMFVQNGGGGEAENGAVSGAGNGTMGKEGKGDWRYHLVVTKREDAHVRYGQAESERAAHVSGQAVV
jgi:predicted O-linked N-acetylglucosamine transferase (SPINDLY family)